MVKIEIQNNQAVLKLKQIAAALKQPRQLYGVLGEELKKIHRQRFEEQKSPEGKAWVPLSGWYRASKHRNRNRILVLRGHLRNQLAYNYDDNSVEFGSARVYARIHQFGGEIKPKKAKALKVGDRYLKKVTIPARPWLGLNKNNMDTLETKATDLLQAQIDKIINKN